MRVSIRDFDASIYQQIRAFLSVRPLPQVNHWESLAHKFYTQGDARAAYYMIDKIASTYGKDVARAALERFTQLPPFLRGRGAPIDTTPQTHPALYFWRDGLRPIQSQNQCLIRIGSNVVAINPHTPTARSFHIFDAIPTQTGFAGMGNIHRPIEWVAYGDGFIYFEPNPDFDSDSNPKYNSESNSNIESNSKSNSIPESHSNHNRLYYVDLRQIDTSLPLEIANKVRIRLSYIEFDTNIRHIAPALADGPIFVTLASPIPILSDTCHLVRLHRDKTRAILDDDFDSECIDLRQYGAIESDIVLPNVEQSLQNDCVAHGDVYLTCCGGMQNRELRFIAPDGSWRTKFIHDAPVCAVIPSPLGAVSLDETGRAFLFNGQNPIDDSNFAIDQLPDDIRSELANCSLSIDWNDKKLFVAKRTKFTKIDDILDNIQAYCITPESIESNYIVQTPTYPSPSLAILRDGSYHFWNDATDSIDFAWQISKETATAEDWHDILSTKNSPSVEDDPRIRWYVD